MRFYSILPKILILLFITSCSAEKIERTPRKEPAPAPAPQPQPQPKPKPKPKPQPPKAMQDTAFTERVNIQSETARANQIMNNRWVAVGVKRPYAIVKDTKRLFKGQPSFRFELRKDDNTLQDYRRGHTKGRAEITNCYATAENFEGLPPNTADTASLANISYFYGKGIFPQGSAIDYSFSIYAPDSLANDVSAIFSQIHGMPDSRLVETPDGDIQYLSSKAYAELMKTMYFKKDMGYDRDTRRKNGWKREQGGYPPLAFGFAKGWFYIKANSDSKWFSDKSDRTNISPEKAEAGDERRSDYKVSTLVYKAPFASFPKNQWVTFHVKLRFSLYDRNEEETTRKGSLQVDMQTSEGIRTIVPERPLDVGRNDLEGYYFKMGIYRVGNSDVPVSYNLYPNHIPAGKKPSAPRFQ